MICTLVVNSLDNAQEVCESPAPHDDFGGLDAGDMDSVKLCVLRELLTGLPFSPTYMSEPVCELDEDGPWLFEVPKDLVQPLAGLNQGELQELGGRWSAIPEFDSNHSNWSMQVVQEFLRDFANLCRQATEQNLSVLAWMSL